MKITIQKSQLNMTGEQFLRKAGYAYIHSRHTGQDSYVRRIGSRFYPRLHMYLEEGQSDKIIFNLHLDQKETSYKGSHAHNAEYDGPVVEGEVSRLKSIINDQFSMFN